MPKITFIVDHTPQGHAPDRPTYKKGETHDLERSYAEKYKNLGYAVDFDAKADRARRERDAADRRAAEESAKLAARGQIIIPAEVPQDWEQLKALAAQLTDDAIRSREHAVKVVQDEMARREALKSKS